MPINITMPALSPTMEEGNLAKWLVKEGDRVSSGDVIAEIETDKATMEVEAVDEGTVARIVVPAGTEGVKVNAVIAVLAGEGEEVSEAAKSGGNGGTATAAPEPPRKDEKEAAPAAAKPAVEAARPRTASPENVVTGSAGPSSEARGQRVFASPLARRIAQESGIDIASVKGSGPHGRIVKSDVQSFVAGGGAKTPSSAATSAAAPLVRPMPDEQVLQLFAEGSYDLVPHDNMRKTIARRLVEAKTTIPHFYLTVDCEIDALLALRSQINAAAPVKKGEFGEAPVYKLSVNDLIIKAYALALRDVPTANVS